MSASTPASRAVFLSYASQDAEAARRICDSLRASGIEVWFDADGGLEHGDEWDQKIRRQIKECVFFMPLISANTQSRHEGYFRIEWELAAERAMGFAHGVPFILPIVIDDTREPDALVPERFRKVQWTRLPGGVVPPDVQARFLKLWSHRTGAISHEAARIENVGAALDDARGRGQAAPRQRRPSLVWAAVALVTLLIGAGWWFSQRAPMSPTAVPPASVTKAEEKKFTPVPSLAAPAASEKSLVVLPLENLSPDPENAFFTDGMHAEMIAALSRVAGLKVISRPSSLRFKGTTATLAEIAQQVGVTNVITGSVRRAAGRVKIQLELRRARDEALLLTKTYDRELSDVIAIQTDVAADIAHALEIRESRGSSEWARYQTKNPEAYDLYLKAVQRYLTPWGQGKRALDEAEGCVRDFQRVLELDPNFAAAASFLSRAHNEAFGRTPDAVAAVEHAQLARKWAEACARLMPGGGGDGALSLYYSNVEYRPARGVEFAENLIRALPNDATGNYYTATALRRQGREAASLEALERALDIDPLNATYHRDHVYSLVALRRRPEAESAIERYLQVTGKNADMARLRTWRFALSGEVPTESNSLPAAWFFRLRRFEDCVRACDAARANTEGWDLVALTLLRSKALARLGRAEESKQGALEALEAVQGVKLVADSRVFAPRLRASAIAITGRSDEALDVNRRGAADYAALGNEVLLFDVDRAEILADAKRTTECVELLKKLLGAPSGLTVPMLKVDPIWDNVRDDPKFKALLADPKNSAPL